MNRMSDAIEFLREHMDDEDLEVTWHQGSFKRVQSGQMVCPGWKAQQKGFDLTRMPGKQLTLRWLPVHRNQGLTEQIRYSNIYYVVDGTEKENLVFLTGLHGYLSPTSLAMIEYTRLVDIAKTMKEIERGEAAKIRIGRLLEAAPTNP